MRAGRMGPGGLVDNRPESGEEGFFAEQGLCPCSGLGGRVRVAGVQQRLEVGGCTSLILRVERCAQALLRNPASKRPVRIAHHEDLSSVARVGSDLRRECVLRQIRPHTDQAEPRSPDFVGNPATIDRIAKLDLGAQFVGESHQGGLLSAVPVKCDPGGRGRPASSEHTQKVREILPGTMVARVDDVVGGSFPACDRRHVLGIKVVEHFNPPRNRLAVSGPKRIQEVLPHLLRQNDRAGRV